MITTLPIDEKDHERFIKFKVEYQHRVGKEVSHPEFFAEMCRVYEGRK